MFAHYFKVSYHILLELRGPGQSPVTQVMYAVCPHTQDKAGQNFTSMLLILLICYFNNIFQAHSQKKFRSISRTFAVNKNLRLHSIQFLSFAAGDGLILIKSKEENSSAHCQLQKGDCFKGIGRRWEFLFILLGFSLLLRDISVPIPQIFWITPVSEHLRTTKGFQFSKNALLTPLV